VSVLRGPELPPALYVIYPDCLLCSSMVSCSIPFLLSTSFAALVLSEPQILCIICVSSRVVCCIRANNCQRSMRRKTRRCCYFHVRQPNLGREFWNVRVLFVNLYNAMAPHPYSHNESLFVLYVKKRDVSASFGRRVCQTNPTAGHSEGYRVPSPKYPRGRHRLSVLCLATPSWDCVAHESPASSPRRSCLQCHHRYSSRRVLQKLSPSRLTLRVAPPRKVPASKQQDEEILTNIINGKVPYNEALKVWQ